MALDRPVDGTAKDQEKTPTLKAIIHFATEVAKVSWWGGWSVARARSFVLSFNHDI